MTAKTRPEALVKSRQRVVDHGEVFTPTWLVEQMLDHVMAESERIDSRVLEPACGSGNFLVPMFKRKLATVQARYGKSDFERRHHALLALMCIYGVELLPDNAYDCRRNLVDVLSSYLRIKPGDSWQRAAERVVGLNVVQGDALTMTTTNNEPIVFPEWGYLGKGRFQRRDFRFDTLARRSSFQGASGDHFEEHEIFTPTREYPAMTTEELAA